MNHRDAMRYLSVSRTPGIWRNLECACITPRH